MICPSHRSLSSPLAKAVCVLLLAAALTATYPANAEEALGRLFFTPERRQALDQQRQFNIQETQVVPEDPSLTINGMVTRSSGRRTIWVNGVAQSEGETASAVTVKPMRNAPGKVTVEFNETQKTQANVGDTVNRETGDISPTLNGGRIETKASGR